MGYIYIYPEKLQFAAYGQFFLVDLLVAVECKYKILFSKFTYFLPGRISF